LHPGRDRGLWILECKAQMMACNARVLAHE
jgi:hypothetical protein